MLVLVIDTSSAAVVAAVVEVANDSLDVFVRAVRTPLAARGHGELLAPSIGDCLAEVGIGARDIEAVVAGTGPGPYTSLRVGLATAAAFADAVGAPTYGVCSLDAIASQAQDEGQLIVATDARRREVYYARYAHGQRVGDVAVGRASDVDVDGVDAVAGAGGELYTADWPQLRLRPERFPTAPALARCAAERIRTRAPAQRLTPMYLRRPDAVVPGAPKPVRQ